MSSANKRKGSQFERDLEDYLNSQGLKARRLPRAGSRDIGDVAIDLDAQHIVMEAKNVASVWSKMAQFLREAVTEASNYEDKYDVTAYPVVVTKTRQKSTGESRVVMTLDQFIDLVNCGYWKYRS